MAKPTTRATLQDYCLRNLGAPVIEINVDEDQIEALSKFKGSKLGIALGRRSWSRKDKY